MKQTFTLPALAAAALGLALQAVPAHAIPRTFVSATGIGTTCTRAAPCADFQTAHNATDPGGEVNCVTDGNYTGAGILTITKSITIDCGGVTATIFAGGVQSILIDTADVVVRLRNLTIEPGGTSSTGIRMTNGKALYVDKCVINGFNETNGRGISFAPTAGTARLYVTDTIISNNEVPDSGSGTGIQIAPSGSASAHVVIDRVRLLNSPSGINVNAPGSGQTIIVQVRNSVVSGGGQGIAVFSSPAGGVSSVTVDGSSSLLNFTGLRTSGPLSFILLARSTIMSNNVGLDTAGGGAILSYQDNQLTGNITDGSPTAVLSQK